MISSAIFVGIDPGKAGGIAWIIGRKAECISMPTTEAGVLRAVMEVASIGSFAVIEKVHSMPGNAARSMFTFGMGYGGLRMALLANKIPFDEVLPTSWMRELGIPKRKKTEGKRDFKNRLLGKAQQLFPDLKVTLKTADALLIAEYCRRVNR